MGQVVRDGLADSNGYKGSHLLLLGHSISARQLHVVEHVS